MVAVRHLPSVELGYDSDYVARDQAQLITRVLPNSPAERAGMTCLEKHGRGAADGEPAGDRPEPLSHGSGRPRGDVEAANDLFHDSTAPNRFATMFFAKYEDATGEIAYVNCGHNPPLLLRAGGDVEWLSPTPTALGFFDAWTCATASLHLGPGDLLVM